MKAFRTLFLLAVALLLGGCVKTYVVGYTDDWADYISGEGSADPLSGTGAANIVFHKLGINCSGTTYDYQKGSLFGAGTRARGDFDCSDGRKIKVDSVVLSTSHGSGTGVDSSGLTGSFMFYTDEGRYEAELARVKQEVTRRGLGVEHLKVGRVRPAAVTQSEFKPAEEKASTTQESAPPAVATVPQVVAQAVPQASQPSSAIAVNDGKKLALIIGNATYREAPLRNPVNDARAIAAKLRSLGFEVLLGENLKQREMTRLITSFGEKLSGKGVGMFYYAGHGMQVKGRNYLLPVDAQISSEASARSESIDLDQVLEHLSGSGSPLNLVILDACRNNPFERRFRSTTGGLAQVDAPKGTLIAFATAPGKVAQDGEGRNSTYTTALLKTLSEPGLTVESVFKRVRGEVARITGDQQIPWESSSLTGDFFFVASTTAASTETKTSEAELLFWQSIKDSNDAEDFNAYLRKFPSGQFADIARNRLKKLGK